MRACLRCSSCSYSDARAERPNPVTHYIIVRADLPRGLQAAQIVHAAGETGGKETWGAHAVVLTVPDERAMRALSLRLTEQGVAHARVVECDAPWTGQVMALGLTPGRKEVLRRHVSSLPLLK